MIFWLIAYFRSSGSRISGQKAILEPEKEKKWKIRNKLWVPDVNFFYKFQNFEKWEYKNDQIAWYFGWLHVLEGQDLEFQVKKQSRDQKKKKMNKKWTNFGSYKKSSKVQNFILVPGVRKTDFYDFSGNFYEENPE